MVLTFADMREFPAESVTEVIITGDMGDLEPGHYEAEAVFVLATEDGEGVERYCRPVPLTISRQDDLNGDLADFILAMKILVSENTDSAPPVSTDADGKIGLDDVLRILREIAEDMPGSP